jgi:AraC-like DNA-binding protein
MIDRTEPPILQETLRGGDVAGALWPFQPLGWHYLRPLHLHDQLELLVLRRGSLRLTLGRERLLLRAGQLAWIVPSVAHRVDQLSRDVDFWSMQLDPWLVHEALSKQLSGSGDTASGLRAYAGVVHLARGLPDPPVISPRVAFLQAIERAAEAAWGIYLARAAQCPGPDPRFPWMPAWDAASERSARAGLLGVFRAALAATESEGDTSRGKGLARSAFDALLSEPALSRRQLCERLDVSEGHLSRRFPELFAASLVQQRARLRLVRFLSLAKAPRASNLLRSCLEAGFGSYSQLHRVFSRFSSFAPNDYLFGEGRLWAGAVVREG